MPQPIPKRPGRRKVPPARRFSERIVFRLTPSQLARVIRRAAALGLTANHYARDRTLGRVRPSRALRRLAEESPVTLDELARFADFIHALLPHLELHVDPASDLAAAVHLTRERFPDPSRLVEGLRSLIEEATLP